MIRRRFVSTTRFATPFVLAVALSGAAGCSLAPSPEPPTLAAPDSWRSATGAAGGPTVADNWWQAFDDPRLDELVAAGLTANHDLALAISRIEEARALARLAGADRLPAVALEAGAARTRLSRQGGALAPGADAVFDSGRVAATASFELDLFGRARNQAEAARQDLLAATSTRDAVRLAVVSDIVTTWFDLAGLDRQVTVTRESIETRRRTEQLVRDRFEGGLVSRLDLERARAERAGAEAALPEIERRRRATENRLAILLGGMPGAIERGRGLEELVVPEVPADLPSELLLRRPDVAVAEARLAAASARVGQARAALFPSIGLTGYYGRESAELSSLFHPAALVWQAAAGLLQPVFQGGRNRALVAASEARQKQAVIAYLATAEGAFRDVEDALFATQTRRERRTALAEQSAALTAAAGIARDRYEEGESDFLEVLDVERSRLVAELELVAARRDELAVAVDLYRALGGGFGGLGAAPASGTGSSTGGAL
ncbi:MAG: efflux transporter outer membrane subunit [Thermoanaerobaculia bacterium]